MTHWSVKLCYCVCSNVRLISRMLCNNMPLHGKPTCLRGKRFNRLKAETVETRFRCYVWCSIHGNSALIQYFEHKSNKSHQKKTLWSHYFFFLCVPLLYHWNSPFWVRFFNPTIEVVTFHLHGFTISITIWRKEDGVGRVRGGGGVL